MRIIGEIAIGVDYNYGIKIDLNQYNRRFYSTDEQVDTTGFVDIVTGMVSMKVC